MENLIAELSFERHPDIKIFNQGNGRELLYQSKLTCLYSGRTGQCNPV